MPKLCYALTLAIGMAFIAGCGTDKKDTGSQFENTDNTVYARIPADPDYLNPILSTSVYARAVNELIFYYLLHFDPNTLELSPQLAKSRPLIEELDSGPHAGGVAYTFEIHDEARWDNGSPITGKDFEFSLKALFNPRVNAAAVRAYLEFISDMEIDPDNPKRFTVFTDEKYIIGEAAVSNIPILPEYVYDPNGLLRPFRLSDLADPQRAAQLVAEEDALGQFADAFNSPQFSREKGFIVGPGPYRFEEWVTGQRIVLQRKENWWGDELSEQFPLLEASPEKAVFKIIPDQTATIASLKSQQIDVTGQIDPKDFVDLHDNESVNALFELHTPPSMVYYYIGLNTKNPKLADKRVRRALAHVVNVPELIENLFYGLAKRTTGPFHPTKPYYHEGLAPIPFDLEKAQALLSEAGWEDTDGNGIVDKEISGERVDMELDYKVTNSSKFANSQALLFQDNAKKAGIRIHIVQKEFTVLIDDLKKRDFEIFSSAWAQDPTLDDPKQLWHTDSDTPDGSNRVGFGNAETDRLIEEIRVTLNEEKRNELYRRFQEIVYEEQPYIFLIAPLERIAVSRRFEAETSARRPGFFVNHFRLRGSD